MKKPSANIMYLEFGSTKMEYPTPSNQRLGCALRHLRFGQLDDYKVELKYSKMLGIPKTAGASRLRIYIYSYIIFMLCTHQSFIPQIALFSYRGSYFKFGGEGSQILWIRCGGTVTHKSRWRCRLVCVGVRVRLSHRVSLEVSSGVCRGQGSQIQDQAVVTRGVVEGVHNLLICVGVRGLQI